VEILNSHVSRTLTQDSHTEGVASIPCCYKDRSSKDAIENYFWRARQIWYSKLGEPSARTGHGLILQLPVDDYCYSSEGVWNKDVPGFYLELRVGPGKGKSGFATVGYQQDGEDGRHQLEVNCMGESLCEVSKSSLSHQVEPIETNNYTEVAHEIGHVCKLLRAYIFFFKKA
jgi:hypothetical protein